jgi:hypothetical protein
MAMARNAREIGVDIEKVLVDVYGGITESRALELEALPSRWLAAPSASQYRPGVPCQALNGFRVEMCRLASIDPGCPLRDSE